jgi:hypothetical protein
MSFTLRPDPSLDFVHILQQFPWDDVTQSLSRSQFTSLAKLRLRIPRNPQYAEIKWLIKEDYFHTFKRILHIENL